MSVWKRTMDYLGLGPDDSYDDYYVDEYEESPQRARRQPEPDQRPTRGHRDESGSEGVVRTLPSRPTFPSRDFDPSPARRGVSQDDSGVQHRPQRPAVRMTSPGEPATVSPRRFEQAQEVADKFKENVPVIMNIEGVDREIARRLIDFASGLCYALDGSMEKVASGVYLLKPPVARDSGYDEYGG